MPCMDYETPSERGVRLKAEKDAIQAPLREQIDQLKHSLAEREAMLCAVLTALAGISKSEGDQLDPWASVMDRIDASEATHGVSMEAVQNWWHDHKIKDQARVAQVREQALCKLTPEERLVLGLK